MTTDGQDEKVVPTLLTAIKAIQAKLQLTNRAVLNLMGIQSKAEADFFLGNADESVYKRTLETLTVLEQSVAQDHVPLTAYLSQLRALPPRNIFLRNRYAFWFANFIDAGGDEDFLITDANQHDFAIIKQIVWSGNLLTDSAGVAHLQTHQKQLVQISENEYQTIKAIMTHFSTATPLFFNNLAQLFHGELITGSPELTTYWDQEAQLLNIG